MRQELMIDRRRIPLRNPIGLGARVHAIDTGTFCAPERKQDGAPPRPFGALPQASARSVERHTKSVPLSTVTAASAFAPSLGLSLLGFWRAVIDVSVRLHNLPMAAPVTAAARFIGAE